MANGLSVGRIIPLQHRLLSHFSSSSYFCTAIPRSGNPFAKLLLDECGYSHSEFQTLEKRFRSFSNAKSVEPFRKSIHFFRDFGFNEEQIKKVITRCPKAITYSAHESLQPKLQRLRDIGFDPLQIAQITAMNPRFLTCSLETRINPNLQTLQKIYGQKTQLLSAIKSSPSLLCTNIADNTNPCLRLLNNAGIEGDNLRFLITRKPSILTLSPETLMAKLDFVRNLGLSARDCARIIEAMMNCNMRKLEEKMKLLEGLGFKAEEIIWMLRKNPTLIRTSCDKLQRNVDFLVQVTDYNVIVSNSYLLNYNVEKNLRPRYKVIEFLANNGILVLKPSILRVVSFSKGDFLEKYVNGSKHYSTLMEMYTGNNINDIEFNK